MMCGAEESIQKESMMNRWREVIIVALTVALAASLISTWRWRYGMNDRFMDEAVFTRLYDARFSGGLRILVVRDEVYGCEYLITTCGTSIGVCRRGFVVGGR
jgi:hypothetical protein